MAERLADLIGLDMEADVGLDLSEQDGDELPGSPSEELIYDEALRQVYAIITNPDTKPSRLDSYLTKILGWRGKVAHRSEAEAMRAEVTRLFAVVRGDDEADSAAGDVADPDEAPDAGAV